MSPDIGENLAEDLEDFEKDVMMYAKRLGEGDTIRFGEIRDFMGEDFGMALREYSNREDPYLVTSPRELREAYNKTKEMRDSGENVVNNTLSYQELTEDPRNEGINELDVVYRTVLEQARSEQNESQTDDKNLRGFH
ncbi:hypothetical protein [Candidatus Nanohalococcus occultus]|uniref:Uncharacterized protein n=1 Tax=Candidatus Nanohalococcus occultus TaxID=2978047 RepID=A0ABY8CJK4_9ARCH|nr:hypothetical protein SVXNc_0859 [Candidatus Nanohaloarchaeota archaeon SVXNc]